MLNAVRREDLASPNRSGDYSCEVPECLQLDLLEKEIFEFDIRIFLALSLGRPHKQDPRTATDLYSDCALELIIVLLKLDEALFVGCSRNQACLGRVKDPGTSLSCVARQSEDKKRAELPELSEQNSALLKKLRAATNCPVELRREVQKSPIKGWWEPGRHRWTNSP